MTAKFFEFLRSWRRSAAYRPGAIWTSPWFQSDGIDHQFVITRI